MAAGDDCGGTAEEGSAVGEEIWQPGPGTYTNHLSGLRKIGKGTSSAWLLGRFSGGARGGLGFEAMLQPDRNAEFNCLRMIFKDTGGKKMGYLLMENEDTGSSSFRGMWVNEDLRGHGLSKPFLAVWLRVCLVIGAAPRTNRIDKPMLSLLLHKFGFVPDSRRCEVEISPGSAETSGKNVLWSPHQKDLGGSFSLRALRDQHMVISSTRPDDGVAICVNTSFGTPPELGELDLAVGAVLEDKFELCATPSALKTAFMGRLQSPARTRPVVEGQEVPADTGGAAP